MLKNKSVNGIIVSTVKLPYTKIWETMIFNANGDEIFSRRYRTQLEASKWHSFYSIKNNARKIKE